MHLLFTNNTLQNLAGSELYIYDMALEFQRRGHQVSCFTLFPGLISDKLHEHGILIATSVTELLALPPVDLIHAHHRLEARLAVACFPLVPIVYASLGPFHPLEQPGEDRGLFTRFLAISQDVKDNLVSYQQIPAEKITVVPNFVDLSRFTATRPLSKNPQRVLLLTNQFKPEGLLAEACKLAGDLELRAIGEPGESVWNVEDYLDWADVVVTSAKGALQAMAMGRAVVVYRLTGSDGLITTANFQTCLYHNFSGRAFGRQFDAASMAAELTAYKLADVEQLQQMVRADFNLERVATSLRQLYQQTITEFHQEWDSLPEVKRYQLVLTELSHFLTGFKDQDNVNAHFSFVLGDYGKPAHELNPRQKETLQFLEYTYSQMKTQREQLQQMEVVTNQVSVKLREQEAASNLLERSSAKINWLEGQNRDLLAENGWQKQSLENTRAELQALLQTRTVKLMRALGKPWQKFKK